jgi:hypothetical protein
LAAAARRLALFLGLACAVCAFGVGAAGGACVLVVVGGAGAVRAAGVVRAALAGGARVRFFGC